MIASGRYLLNFRKGQESYTRCRQAIGRAILLGLEVLVAGHIIKTVAVRPILASRCWPALC